VIEMNLGFMKRMTKAGILAAALALITGGCDSPQQPGPPLSRPADQSEAATRLGVPKDLTLQLGGGVSMKLILIPSGEFLMGSPGSERERKRDEGPQHQVTISRPFYMGIYPVTQEQYAQVTRSNPSKHQTIRGWEAGYVKDIMDKNPARHSGARNPVDSVSWADAARFCEALSGRVGKRVRLPSEAEWEYACRAGTATAFNTGQTLRPSQASYNDNYDRRRGGGWPVETVPVGSFAPNAWGLHDMHGNVFEWCADWYDPEFYKASPAVDPQGPSSGSLRVLRGGAYLFPVRYSRSASRYNIAEGPAFDCIGFRVVVEVQDAPES